MENNFKQTINQLKKGLSSFITSETSKETIDTIASLDKLVDTTVSEYDKLTQDYSGLKDDYIKVIKGTGFSAKIDPIDEALNTSKELSFEECLEKAMGKNNN